MSARYGLVEAGGTKFVLGISDEAGNISARHRIPTTTPSETLPAMIDWFRAQGGEYSAFGIASFGPLDLDERSAHWGYITRTTKPHWSNTDLVGPLAAAFGSPVAIDTDVNGPALAEYLWGAGRGQGNCVYLTIGTGVGGGAVINGKILHGVSHPEMGHFRLPRHPDDTNFAGACPFHGDCLEGLASGPSIIARWGASLSEFPSDHPGHDMIAWYLAQACCTLQAIMEPGRIILGGGVMGTPGLLDRIRVHASSIGKGYFVGNPDDVIVLPALGDTVGLKGALAVALSLTS